VSLNRFSGEVAQGREFRDRSNVVVRTVIGDRLYPAK
jgi:hypothetical protein